MITVQLLNRTFTVDLLTVIVTPNAVYARIEMPGREG